MTATKRQKKKKHRFFPTVKSHLSGAKQKCMLPAIILVPNKFLSACSVKAYVKRLTLQPLLNPPKSLLLPSPQAPGQEHADSLLRLDSRFNPLHPANTPAWETGSPFSTVNVQKHLHITPQPHRAQHATHNDRGGGGMREPCRASVPLAGLSSFPAPSDPNLPPPPTPTPVRSSGRPLQVN